MDASKTRVFHYHGDACPLGGHITHPTETVVQAQASSSLSPAGGHASARTGPFRVEGLVSCEQASSHVSGVPHKQNGSWMTMVTSVVENLNLLEVVIADRVVSRFALEHPADGYHPRISMIGSHFENLRVAGVAINPVMDIELMKGTEDGSFPKKPWQEDDAFCRKAADHCHRVTSSKDTPGWVKERYGWMKSPEERAKKGYVLCSVVQELQGAKQGSSFGHVLHVAGFGNLFFGEVVVHANSYRMTMIRAEMGCIAEGNMTFGTSYSNGLPMP